MKKIVCIIISLLVLVSCLGTKKVVETKHEVSKETKQDSISVNNKEIELIPSLIQEETFELPEEVGQLLDDFDRRLSTQDGKASAGISKKGNTILIRNIIPGSKNEKVESTSKVKQTDTQKETINKSIYKRIIALPWWVMVLGILFLLPYVIKLFSPHAALFSSFIRYFKQ